MGEVNDTIAAVSSPPGRSLRGLIRISGPKALDAAGELLTANCRERVSERPRTLTPVRLTSPPIASLLAFFPAPGSYTGEDVVELQPPGNAALLDRLLSAAVAAGARLAEPGEFTFRAFTAGKLDLTQAEGVAATIAATSDSQLRAAAMLREGRLGSWAGEVVEALGEQLALVEAGIDFVDQEDVTPIAPAELAGRLEAVARRLEDLQHRSRSWGALEALPRVVLAGPPSSGKSTLFNALLGRRRALVSAAPGTTRDVLAEPLELAGVGQWGGWGGRRVEVMLLDIAGLDELLPAADDVFAAGDSGGGVVSQRSRGRPGAQRGEVDEQARAAARRALNQADLVLRLVAPGRRADPPSAWPPDPPHAAPPIHVYTMSDMLPSPPDRSEQPAGGGAGSGEESRGLRVSAVTGEGLEALRAAIAQRVGEAGVSVASNTLALQPRHQAAIAAAGDHLARACQLCAAQRDVPMLDSPELIAGCLRAALDELAGLGGRLTPDEVIGRVFATFCVGK